jgi:hypothetical protein
VAEHQRVTLAFEGALAADNASSATERWRRARDTSRAITEAAKTPEERDYAGRVEALLKERRRIYADSAPQG